jgi:hypothetical protein
MHACLKHSSVDILGSSLRHTSKRLIYNSLDVYILFTAKKLRIWLDSNISEAIGVGFQS